MTTKAIPIGQPSEKRKKYMKPVDMQTKSGV